MPGAARSLDSRLGRAGPLRSAASCPAPLQIQLAAATGRARTEAAPVAPLSTLLIGAGRFREGAEEPARGLLPGICARPFLPFASCYPYRLIKASPCSLQVKPWLEHSRGHPAGPHGTPWLAVGWRGFAHSCPAPGERPGAEGGREPRVRARKQPGRGGSGPGTPEKGQLCPGSLRRASDSRDRDASPEPGVCGCPSGLSHAERLTKVCVPRESGTIEPPSGSQVTSSLIEIFATSPHPLHSPEARGDFKGAAGGRGYSLSDRGTEGPVSSSACSRVCTTPRTNGFAGFFSPLSPGSPRCVGIPRVCDPPPSPSSGFASAATGAINSAPALTRPRAFPTRFLARRVFSTELNGDFHFLGNLPITTKYSTNLGPWARMPVPARLPGLQDGVCWHVTCPRHSGLSVCLRVAFDIPHPLPLPKFRPVYSSPYL